MINEENLNKMYDGLIDDRELTTKELNSYGFSSKDLTHLISDGFLVRIERGHYSILSIDNLFHYGKQLIALKKYDRATKCFLKCYELNPKHSGTCFQLFLRSIQNKNYEKAFEYFEHFYNSGNKYYKNDNNFYLYLLSMITKIPEKYKEYVSSLKLEDIKIDFNDKRFKDSYGQNKVRFFAFYKKFTLASKQLNELIKKYEILNAQDIIVRTLLQQAGNIQYNLKKNIARLAIEKNYNQIISCLEEEQTKRQLSLADEYILFLAKEISKIIETEIIPEKEILSTNKLFEAIKGRDFELALSLSKDYIERNNINPNDNTIFILLKDIIELIKVKTAKLRDHTVVKTIENETTSTKENVVPKTNINSISNNPTFATIISYLIAQDFDNSFRSLRAYLNNLNKNKYEFLIIDLIKISLIEEDVTFSKPMIALNYISRGNYTFDISEYILNFYESLAQNKFIEARIYLDIIAQSNKLGQSCVLTDGLEKILNTTEKMLNYRRNNEILTKVEASIKGIANKSTSVMPTQTLEVKKTEQKKTITSASGHHDDELDVAKKEQNIEAVASQTAPQKAVTEPIKPDYDDFEYINKKLNELHEKGILLLKPMNDSRRKRIHNIIKEIPDVVSFSIGLDSNRRIVLRHKPNSDKYVDFSSITKEGNRAYSKGEYDKCIELYRKILEFGEPKAWVYAKLGLAYMKKLDKDTAIDFLTIATELAKKEQTDFDFTELIASLKGLIATKDKKPKVKMSINDFNNNTENYYGIENMHELAELITSGMKIDDACATLGLDDEQKTIATLILARECYLQENYTIGDQYLKKVEKTKNKSKFVTSLFEEIRKNRRFYKNRVDENYKPLVLTLQQKNN